MYGQCHLDIDDLKIKVIVDFNLVTPEMLTVTCADVVVFASGSTMTDRFPRLRRCAEYQAARFCARFEVLRAEELAASILGSLWGPSRICVSENLMCSSPTVYHDMYFRSFKLGF